MESTAFMNTPRPMSSICSALEILFLIAGIAFGEDAGAPIPIWPHGAPGETGAIGVEHDTTKAGDQLVAGKSVIRLGNVSNPTITLYHAPKDKDTGASVIVFPGGGYSILAMDLEGTEVCGWLNSIGVNCALLKYRVPARPGKPRYAAALQDAQRAIGLVRYHAHDWQIDPQRVGVLGFSAGGHLVAAASTNFDARTYDAVDDADKVSCRPDFAILIYPAYLTAGKDLHTLAPELTVRSDTPPAFLAQTEDDPVHVECSLVYYQALKAAKVPAEMHLFPAGGHGYGLRPTSAKVTTWPQLAAQWMESRGLLKGR
jgi:acetyl esterase/lipase